MGGAYVAKPEVVATPNVPPGWPTAFGGWPHPGTYPPGYVPSYTLTLVAPEYVYIDAAAGMTISLRDHATYETQQPDSESKITWSAVKNNQTVPLRFSGDPAYSDSISSSYESIGQYWGAQPLIEFDITDEDIGETIQLTATTTVFEGYNIVVQDTLEVVYNYDISMNAPSSFNDLGPTPEGFSAWHAWTWVTQLDPETDDIEFRKMWGVWCSHDGDITHHSELQEGTDPGNVEASTSASGNEFNGNANVSVYITRQKAGKKYHCGMQITVHSDNTGKQSGSYFLEVLDPEGNVVNSDSGEMIPKEEPNAHWSGATKGVMGNQITDEEWEISES